MKKQDISSKINNINTAILSGRLAVAFSLLRNFSEQLMTWEITDEITRLEESYRYMLLYAMKGVNDPQRQRLYIDIETRLRALTDRLDRQASIAETPTLYFNTLRYFNRSDRKSITTRLREYDNKLRDKGLKLPVQATTTQDSLNSRIFLEQAERDFFNTLWTELPISSQDYDSLATIFSSQQYSRDFRQLVISAIYLGLQEYYDVNRFKLLCLAYDKGDDITAPVAMIALLLSLYRYRETILEPTLIAQIALLADKPEWSNDLRDAFLEIVRARDTERITRTMQDELVPEMMKLSPELRDKFKNFNNASELMDSDMNPEWQEMLEKSGIADKMKQLLEIQMEGGDVFMSTFSHLKMFPFFNEIGNWFLPFSSEHSAIARLDTTLVDLAQLLENTPLFCNSDKYSFILSLTSVPEPQRQMIRAQFDAQVDAMLEMEHSSETPTGRAIRRRVMNRYVQDLYRFFKLFRRKSEFRDPFVEDLNLVNIPVLTNQFKDVESLLTIAEFYFKHKYYQDALTIFKVVEQISRPEIQLFEKIGYCYERLHDYTLALQYYEQAELLNADSLWTLRHIALCLRLLGDPSRALSYYRRVSEKEETDTLGTSMAIGNCFVELGKYDEAVKYFYKVDYLEPGSHKARRQLAWCLMMQRDFDKSKKLYEEIINDNPTPQDYLNMGHLALTTGDDINALNYYKLCKARADGTLETFSRMIGQDVDAFITLGLDPNIIPLILDAVTYSEH